jgi:hypothetical protein
MKTSDVLLSLQKDFGRIEVATKTMEQLLLAENYAGATQVLPVLQSELKGFSELLNTTYSQVSFLETRPKENQENTEQSGVQQSV